MTLEVLVDRTEVLDGVEVTARVEREIYRSRKLHHAEDRVAVSAPHVGCGELELTATAGSYFVALGRQDATTGHARFDDRYIVKGNDVAALRYWFGEAEADAMLSTYDPLAVEPYALSIEPGWVRLTSTTSWTPSEGEGTDGPMRVTRLDEASRAAAVLANRGRRLATAWRERLAQLAPTELGAVWRTDEHFALVLERGRTRVRLDFPWHLPHLRRRGLRTRLAMPWPAEGPALEGLAELDVDWHVAGEGRLAIGWEHIVDDPERLAAALAVLARAAERLAAATGPYR